MDRKIAPSKGVTGEFDVLGNADTNFGVHERKFLRDVIIQFPKWSSESKIY